ncbi:linoleate 9S-lipoxygenase-like [Trifolium pratense]|uniref:linoleate 9S-lipoxygenase-like n=1 Tax=Trifolium pratense TaxID=57577 RepID=UPI001E697C8E|nr:linoleate 9S-lipoxygenase-like [Trifolium pratense]
MTTLNGTVVLVHNSALNFNVVGNAVPPSFLDTSVAFKLISDSNADGTGKGKVGKKAFLDGLLTSIPTLGDKKSTFRIHFEWHNDDMGIPGAFYVENFMEHEFFLVSLSLEDVPNHGPLHFICNSWVYNTEKYKTHRIFFANKTYIPIKTPDPLVYYRQEELKTLRGDGTGERQVWERIYDYDVYNDLGEPDKNPALARPVLGGSSTLPYPRRCRTGRKPTQTDPNSESRRDDGYVYIPRDELLGFQKLPEENRKLLGPGKLSPNDELLVPQKSPARVELLNLNISLVRDELFNLKISSDVLINTHNLACQYDTPQCLSEKKIKNATTQLEDNPPEFNTFQDVLSLFHGKQPNVYPLPKVIQEDTSAWMTDEEFTREMIAGVNPNVIRKLEEFPPKSKVDIQLYGDNTTTITEEDLKLKPYMGGKTVEQAIQDNKLYILDHHDAIFPYLRKLNDTGAKAYATRTILYLQDDGTLKPLAIELSKPHPQGDSFGPVSNVYLPATEGVEASIWLLAKAYVVVNDSCYHQLISHWLNTHATVEPFIIATNRHLSVVHPIHKLLLPHYRNTMNINANARIRLINAEGTIESVYMFGDYSMQFSSDVYKHWVFQEEGLPNDLIKRGVAVEDETKPHGIRLLIEDYPYASDGLEIWAAIKSWVKEYVNFYYESDADIEQDSELQAFWKELVEVGHGDLKDSTWWHKMEKLTDLIETCTILIWIASALHAAINFGQYPYGGYILNRPTKSRRFMPEDDELAKDYEKAYLRTITPMTETIRNMQVMGVLSAHVSNEQYLGQRIEGDLWTSEAAPVEAYNKFGRKLAEIEEELIKRNKDESLRNRNGPVKMPYTVLHPSSEGGVTFRGIPNSISI